MGRNSAIPKRWFPYTKFGQQIPGTRFIAFKCPLHSNICDGMPQDARFTPQLLVTLLPTVKFVIDLTFTDRYYRSKELKDAGLLYSKIMVMGHEVPSKKVISKFCDEVDLFLQNDPDGLVGVHCTHGVNRTGYLICKYMITKLGFQPQDAINAFAEARGHRIERINYLEDLGVQGEEAVALLGKKPVDVDERAIMGHHEGGRQYRDEGHSQGRWGAPPGRWNGPPGPWNNGPPRYPPQHQGGYYRPPSNWHQPPPQYHNQRQSWHQNERYGQNWHQGSSSYNSRNDRPHYNSRYDNRGPSYGGRHQEPYYDHWGPPRDNRDSPRDNRGPSRSYQSKRSSEPERHGSHRKWVRDAKKEGSSGDTSQPINSDLTSEQANGVSSPKETVKDIESPREEYNEQFVTGGTKQKRDSKSHTDNLEPIFDQANNSDVSSVHVEGEFRQMYSPTCDNNMGNLKLD